MGARERGEESVPGGAVGVELGMSQGIVIQESEQEESWRAGLERNEEEEEEVRGTGIFFSLFLLSRVE